jgi:Fe-S cluster biogenesis protein NfuA
MLSATTTSRTARPSASARATTPTTTNTLAAPVLRSALPPRRLVFRRAAAADNNSAPAAAGPAASPFSSASVHRTVGGGATSDSPTLSIESVDACLDEVRPYLIADGGDVEVVLADPSARRVELRLRGACSSCASSDATMRMGLERAIRARFGADVAVVQASSSSGGGEGEGGGNGGGPARATLEAVDGHLNMLRSAVAGLGGQVRVAEVSVIPPEGGSKNAGKQRAVVHYKGPRSIGNGIKAAILERFQGDVAEVELVDFPTDA